MNVQMKYPGWYIMVGKHCVKQMDLMDAPDDPTPSSLGTRKYKVERDVFDYFVKLKQEK